MTTNPRWGLPGVPVRPGEAVGWPAITEALPMLGALDQVPQDPRHHAEGSVGVHTRMVLAALLADPAWAALPERDRAVLAHAALLHDLGKRTTTRVQDDGRITSNGHARAGALQARRLLWERGVPFAEREAIVALVRWHMRPGYLVTQADPVREVLRIACTARCDWLAMLARADTLGRVAPAPEEALAAIGLFEDVAREEDCLTAPFPFANAESRVCYFRTTGRDPRYAAFDARWGEVIVMAGLPASGKDSWLTAHAEGRPVISLDAIRAERRLPQGAEAAAVGYEDLKGYLRRRESVIWNATSLKRDLRAGIIGTALEYGARVRVVYCETDMASQRARNAARPEATRVPEDTMSRMLDGWDIPDGTEAHEVECVLSAGQRRAR